MDIGHLKKPFRLSFRGAEPRCRRPLPASVSNIVQGPSRGASAKLPPRGPARLPAKESFPALGGHGKTGKPPGEPATMGSHRAFDMKPPGLEEWKATRQPPGLEKWIGTCLGWNRSKLFPGHWKFPCWDPAAQLLVACCLVLNPTPAFYGVQSAWSVGCWLWKARMALVAALVLWLLPWGQIPRSWRSWSRLVPKQTSNYPST